MKTLADFKRRLVIGTKLKVTFHGGPMVVNGNTGQTVFPQPEPAERIVAKVQSQSVAFTKPNSDRLSWLTYPKAADFKVENGAAVIYQNGKKALSYDFI